MTEFLGWVGRGKDSGKSNGRDEIRGFLRHAQDRLLHYARCASVEMTEFGGALLVGWFGVGGDGFAPFFAEVFPGGVLGYDEPDLLDA
jgi:hypothetical protein